MSDLPQDPAQETEPPSHLRSNIREAISGARCLVMDELVKELVLALEKEGFRLDEFVTALGDYAELQGWEEARKPLHEASDRLLKILREKGDLPK